MKHSIFKEKSNLESFFGHSSHVGPGHATLQETQCMKLHYPRLNDTMDKKAMAQNQNPWWILSGCWLGLNQWEVAKVLVCHSPRSRMDNPAPGTTVSPGHVKDCVRVVITRPASLHSLSCMLMSF